MSEKDKQELDALAVCIPIAHELSGPALMRVVAYMAAIVRDRDNCGVAGALSENAYLYSQRLSRMEHAPSSTSQQGE